MQQMLQLAVRWHCGLHGGENSLGFYQGMMKFVYCLQKHNNFYSELFWLNDEQVKSATSDETITTVAENSGDVSIT